MGFCLQVVVYRPDTPNMQLQDRSQQRRAAKYRLRYVPSTVASLGHDSDMPEVDYNSLKSALVAIPRDFKVKLIPRDQTSLDKCLHLAEERRTERG